MAVTDGHGVPVAVHVASASPHETRLVEATLDNHFAPQLPQKLLGDLVAFVATPAVCSITPTQRGPNGSRHHR